MVSVMLTRNLKFLLYTVLVKHCAFVGPRLFGATFMQENPIADWLGLQGFCSEEQQEDWQRVLLGLSCWT